MAVYFRLLLMSFISFCRVRLYVNVPGSLIVAGSSNKPIRKPPSSTKMEPVAAQDADTAATSKMTASGAIRL